MYVYGCTYEYTILLPYCLSIVLPVLVWIFAYIFHRYMYKKGEERKKLLINWNVDVFIHRCTEQMICENGFLMACIRIKHNMLGKN